MAMLAEYDQQEVTIDVRWSLAAAAIAAASGDEGQHWQ